MRNSTGEPRPLGAGLALGWTSMLASTIVGGLGFGGLLHAPTSNSSKTASQADCGETRFIPLTPPSVFLPRPSIVVHQARCLRGDWRRIGGCMSSAGATKYNCQSTPSVAPARTAFDF